MLKLSQLFILPSYFSVDATAEKGRLGRLVNHSKCEANLKTVLVKSDDGRPKIFLRAIRDIDAGEELLYDYSDKNPISQRHFSWLRT